MWLAPAQEPALAGCGDLRRIMVYNSFQVSCSAFYQQKVTFDRCVDHSGLFFFSALFCSFSDQKARPSSSLVQYEVFMMMYKHV